MPPSPQQPLHLSDSQMSQVLAMAEPLAVPDRDLYLRRLAELLAREPVIGDGVVGRAAREAQRQFMRPPSLEELRYRPRSRRVAPA